MHDEFKTIFCTDYLYAEKPNETKAEIKLYVKDKQPFYSTPGRLLYNKNVTVRVYGSGGKRCGLPGFGSSAARFGRVESRVVI